MELCAGGPRRGTGARLPLWVVPRPARIRHGSKAGTAVGRGADGASGGGRTGRTETGRGPAGHSQPGEGDCEGRGPRPVDWRAGRAKGGGGSPGGAVEDVAGGVR